MSDEALGFFVAGALVLAFAFGWLAAHAEVNTECVRQASFYVGSNTFDCKLREQTP